VRHDGADGLGARLEAGRPMPFNLANASLSIIE